MTLSARTIRTMPVGSDGFSDSQGQSFLIPHSIQPQPGLSVKFVHEMSTN